MIQMKFDDDDQTELESEKQTVGLIDFIKDLVTLIPVPDDDDDGIKESEAHRPIPPYKPRPPK